jgi:50S ribosomal subunit-associated GTPase HflX
MRKIENLKKICDELTSNAPPEKPVIAACGLMNAGKSYLLNMLTQHIEQEYFKTADQRETTSNKKLETEQYIYLDTPGLDAVFVNIVVRFFKQLSAFFPSSVSSSPARG